jgi:Tfp pilus assembly protein PilO
MAAIRFSAKEKIGLTCAVIFMSFALIDRLIVSPINSKLKKISQEIKLSQAQLSFDLSNVSQKDEIAKEYEKYAEYQKDGGSDEEKMTTILSVLEDLGRDSGLTLLDIKPQQATTVNSYKQYSISIEAEGKVDVLINFLYKLNKSEHLLRVEKLRLNARDKDAKVIKASIVVTKIFVL